MVINVITLFPGMFRGVLEESIIKRGQEKGLVEIKIYNLRDFSQDKHHKVDDRPYGGGPGMVLSIEPVWQVMQFLEAQERPQAYNVLLTPRGKLLTQAKVKELSEKAELVILCGHYEGFDERIHQAWDWDEVSIGEYVLSGGEIPALALIDAITRLVPGVVGNPESVVEESFVLPGQLDYPQYTRPRDFRGQAVPEVLLSGNHSAIKEWRRKQVNSYSKTS